MRDQSGRPIAAVTVQLQSGETAQTVLTRTDSQGMYRFSGLQEGVYVLSASTSGFETSRIPSLFLGAKEAKNVDLTLGPPKKPETTAPPQFFDQPEFTVAGVTDTTSLGGHGSDTIVRTREKLAKETVALGTSAGGAAWPDLGLAEKSLREKIEREPEKADLHHHLAELEEKKGDPLEAVRQYQRAAELDPSERYLFDWGAELLLHHAPEPAIEVFTKGNRLFPRSERMLIGLGAAWFSRGSYDQAIRPLCEASDLSPGDAIPYLFLGKMQRAETTSSADVTEKLHRFVQLQAENAEANYYYAVALWRLRKNADKARESEMESLLKHAIRLDPQMAPAYLQLGILHSEQGDGSAAIASFQQAIHADPQLEEAHYRLAQAYRQIGQTDKAKAELEVYQRLAQESAQQAERERHEIRQFVYTLRDQPAPQNR